MTTLEYNRYRVSDENKSYLYPRVFQLGNGSPKGCHFAQRGILAVQRGNAASSWWRCGAMEETVLYVSDKRLITNIFHFSIFPVLHGCYAQPLPASEADQRKRHTSLTVTVAQALENDILAKCLACTVVPWYYAKLSFGEKQDTICNDFLEATGLKAIHRGHLREIRRFDILLISNSLTDNEILSMSYTLTT